MSGRPRTFDEAEVLKRVMLTFWQHGYEATGMSQLEEVTGLGRQSLYSAFGDKRALLARAIENYFSEVIEPSLIGVLDAPGSPRANLERVLDSWEIVAEDPEFHGCLLGNCAREVHHEDEDMRAMLERKFKLMENAFARTLDRAIERGEIQPKVSSRQLAKTLVALAQGLSVVARVKTSPSFVRDVVASARALLA